MAEGCAAMMACWIGFDLGKSQAGDRAKGDDPVTFFNRGSRVHDLARTSEITLTIVDDRLDHLRSSPDQP